MTQPIQVLAFDDTIGCKIEDFLAVSTELGEPLIELGFLIQKAFDSCRDLIEYGLFNSAPKDVIAFIRQQPMAKHVGDIMSFRESNRTSPFFNHLSTVSESICALNWITMHPAPCQFIREMTDAGKYYGNRVLAAHKGQPNHTNFVNKYTEILKSLESYVKQYFVTGFTWGSAQGGMIQPRPDIPAPPPPPPATAPDTRYGDVVGTGDAVREALIRDLNQGSAITTRLRHVNREEEDRAPPVRASTSHCVTPSRTVANQKTVKPPKFILEGRKWVVENYRNDTGLDVDCDMTQSLVMFNSIETMLHVKNKINNICIDSCKKVSLLIKGVISCVEVIRCESLKIQCDGNVPLINISNSNSIQIFVNEESKGVEVISSMSSSINMCLISPDGDYLECPVPELIKSVFEGSKLTSSIVETI